MTEKEWEKLEPLVARWKKFTAPDDAERIAAVEHSPTPELQRLVKEFGELAGDIDRCVAAVEKKYGLFETGDIGADLTPEPNDARRHSALLALRQAHEEANAEIADREAAGE